MSYGERRTLPFTGLGLQTGSPPNTRCPVGPLETSGTAGGAAAGKSLDFTWEEEEEKKNTFWCQNKPQSEDHGEDWDGGMVEMEWRGREGGRGREREGVSGWRWSKAPWGRKAGEGGRQGCCNECVVIDRIVRQPDQGPCAVEPSPSVDNAVSYSSLLRLIKNRQIDVTGTVELYLTLTHTHTHTHAQKHAHTHTQGILFFFYFFFQIISIFVWFYFIPSQQTTLYLKFLQWPTQNIKIYILYIYKYNYFCY